MVLLLYSLGRNIALLNFNLLLEVAWREPNKCLQLWEFIFTLCESRINFKSILWFEFLLSTGSTSLSFGLLLKGVKFLMVRSTLTRSASPYEFTHLFEYFARFFDVGAHFLFILGYEGHIDVMLLLGPMTSIDVWLFWLLQCGSWFWRLWLLL